MRFGPVSVADAAGAVLAHSVRTGKVSFKKGRLLSADDAATLAAAGIEEVVAARLEVDDVGEDSAAARLAAAVMGANIAATAAFTGRVNLLAECRGLLVYDRDALDAVNLVDESLTVAMLPPYEAVQPKQIVATVKVIPFATPERAVAACESAALGDMPLVRIVPFVPRRVGLIQTRLPGTKESVLDKTVGVLAGRVEGYGSALADERRCAHRSEEICHAVRAAAAAGCEMILIAGASAITDRRDVIPAGIVAAGGTVHHFGMPVDPGNLLLVGEREGIPVVGLPGCARSPKFNGFDWVLQRLCADLAVTRRDIMRMGAGGLLVDIPTRPLPRAEATNEATRRKAPSAPRIGALILAAGQSRRMGAANKLLAEVEGVPMVRRVADAVGASKAEPVVAVVGHEAGRVAAVLPEGVTTVENPDYAEGLSSSLRRGLAALPDDVDGVVVCLGDMPRVAAGDIDRLIATFNPVEGRAICVPTFGGKRGNPMLFARRFFAEVCTIAGDVGARQLIGAYPEAVCEVEMGEGVLIDVDTPQALEALRRAPDAAA